MRLPRFLTQDRHVYRYVLLKATYGAVPPTAVVITALWGIWAGAATLAAGIGLGTLVDLAFFAALANDRRKNGNER